MRNSLILAAVLAATTLGPTAYAVERVARPLSATALKDIASTTQDVTVTGVMSNMVTVAPLTTSANGFGISKIASRLDTAPFGTMPVVPVPANATDAVVRERANQWVDSAFPTFRDRYSAWLRSKGLSIGFYNFTQEVNVQTAAGIKKKSIAFNAIIDSSGKPTYGMPKIVDSDPLTLDVRYIPLKPSDGLPADWVYEGAGTIQWRVLNKKMEDVSGWTVIETNGAFDTTGEEVLPEEKLACLMDRASSPSCTGPTDVKTLMGQLGTTTAFVSYSHSPDPVLQPTDVEGEFAPVTGLSIDERTQQCGVYTNKGSFGYILEAVADWYVADLSSSNITYQLMNQTSIQSVSPTRSYEKSVSVQHLGMGSADGYIITPEEGETELISRSDARIKNGTIDIAYLAPLQMKVSAPLNFTGTAPVQNLSVAGGTTQEYVIGHNWQHAFGWGQHDYYTTFTIDSLVNVSSAVLEHVTFDDYFMVQVNGKTVYVGAPGPANTLEMGGWVSPRGTCGQNNVGWSCGTLTSERVSPVWSGLLVYSCPPGSLKSSSWGGGSFGLKCYKLADYQYYSQCYYDYDYGSGYSCHNGCDFGEAKYGNYGGSSSCGYLERGKTWAESPRIDLRPYLQNGQNTIFLRTLVGGKGHGAMTMSISACGQ